MSVVLNLSAVREIKYLNDYFHEIGITMPVKSLQVICSEHKYFLLPALATGSRNQ